MANQVYGKGRQNFAAKLIDWVGDNIKAVLVDTAAYALQIDVHEFLSDIPGGARIATSGNLAGKTNVLGVLDADDPTLAAVAGASVELVVIYQDTGAAGTSRLIAALDTLTGLPFAPSGGDVIVTWANDANKILKL